jgi:hypothetical protein
MEYAHIPIFEVLLENKKNNAKGQSKTIACPAKFLLPKVEAGWLLTLGSQPNENKYWAKPISETRAPATTRQLNMVFRFFSLCSTLSPKKKTIATQSHINHLVIKKSTFVAQNIDSVPRTNSPKNKIVTREKLRVVTFILRCDQNQTVSKMPKYT